MERQKFLLLGERNFPLPWNIDKIYEPACTLEGWKWFNWPRFLYSKLWETATPVSLNFPPKEMPRWKIPAPRWFYLPILLHLLYFLFSFLSLFASGDNDELSFALPISLSLWKSLFSGIELERNRVRDEKSARREKRKRVAAEGILERKQKLGRRESAGPIVVGRWLAWVRLKRIGGEYNGALRIYNISGIRLAGDPFAMWNLWKCGGWEEGKPAKSGE